MQIPSSLRGSSETIRDVPGRLLATLAEGQAVQATVVAKLAADVVKIKLADTVLQLKTDQSLQVGQQVSLQKTQQEGEAVLKLQPVSSPRIDTANLVATLKQGQQLAVEVIKLLSDQRVLVRPALIDSNHQHANKAMTDAVSRLPSQIEVNVQALKQSFRPGDKLALEVVKEQPLSIHLREHAATRAELIQRYQNVLLPQGQKTSITEFHSFNSSLPKLTQVPAVQQAMTELLQNVSDKSALQQANTLKQSLNNSGVFLEAHLKSRQDAGSVKQDFKANLLRLTQVIEQHLNKTGTARLDTNSKLFQSLPAEVQQAVMEITRTPRTMQFLPAQIQNFLATKGQSPARLLQGLLSAKHAGVLDQEKVQPPSRMVPNQANIISKDMPASAQPPQLQKAQQASVLVQDVNVNDKPLLQHAGETRPNSIQSGIKLKENLTNPSAQQGTKATQSGESRVIEQSIKIPDLVRPEVANKVMQSLPADIQQALRQVVSSPTLMQNLPAQVRQFLSTQGVTPMNVLLGLVSALQSGETEPNFKVVTPGLVSGLANQVMRPQQEAPVQTQARMLEWQMLRDLLREVESVGSRIQLNQLTMLKEQDSPNNVNVWLFDLPIKERQQMEMMQLRIEQHLGKKEDEGDTIWQIQLNLETVNLGPMQAQIVLQKTDVNVVLLAERPASAELLAVHVDELNQRLQSLGINVSHLDCRQAPISKETSAVSESGLSSRMVDISV